MEVEKMRSKIVFTMLGVLLCTGGLAQATNIDFNSVNPIGTVQTGDDYEQITLHDSALVNMTGGSVESVWSYDFSTFQMQGGNVPFVISVHNASNITISGGSVADLELFDSGVVSISGGNITGHLGTWDTATVHIYAKSFNVSSNPNGWLIAGNWDDTANSPFAILYRGMSTLPPGSPGSPVILHIPEPATFVLFGIGLWGLVRRSFK
jgi:hypothetical protein